jgi:hypothetical protein
MTHEEAERAFKPENADVRNTVPRRLGFLQGQIIIPDMNAFLASDQEVSALLNADLFTPAG